MNQKQANRLVKLAEFLLTVPKEKWDFSSFEELKSVNVCTTETRDDEVVSKISCGTTACALGWCPTLFPKNFKAGLFDKINEALKNKDIEILKDLMLDGKNFDLQVKYKGEWSDDYYEDNYDGDAFDDGVAEFFGITTDEVHRLFLTNNSYGIAYEKVTPQMVSKAIYKVLDKYGYKAV